MRCFGKLSSMQRGMESYFLVFGELSVMIKQNILGTVFLGLREGSQRMKFIIFGCKIIHLILSTDQQGFMRNLKDGGKVISFFDFMEQISIE